MIDFSDPAAYAAHAAAAIAESTGVSAADFALVLGSGWNAAADTLGETIASLPLGDVPGFAAPVVAGHGGELRLVRVATGKVAVILTGRTHYYEGRGVAQVVHGVRTAAALGATDIVLTNGCGGLNPAWAPGTTVLIADHINLTGDTPLRGATFIDMTDAYSPALRDLARRVDPDLPEGVYCQFRGPQYETPAEVRMAGAIGADLVGMSTGLECIAARAEGMRVLGISLVTNAAAGVTAAPLDHAEVIAAGKAAQPRLAALLRGLVVEL
ncbi:purine-nucleoside phosphorylase [Propionicicella superfundia]|uniref:purine-nucleoside phosphorylase n=1 Tax=Propionicicella superfundia TaxID=348582 RepID=UPI000424A30A|nr:purine-nucleoside phosphorylase [Propionicicella superfundia]